ncbi:hypothetical protein CC86DRAFT_465019 [Ophiobolus disseminans]|uniref:Uncharacterized protein n=1 Tax=Ophiobolus disseminans TaxID=1469910 RepID=A0A6A7A8B6_9PLEO|nr:hypothetical protein CC86DRAFT_465019 [Ophiobolus disseminans]
MASAVTPFTPPASCTTAWIGTLAGEGGRALRRGVGCVAGTLTWDPNCYPSTTQVEAGCPAGYDTAFKWSTAAACCPRGFTQPGRTQSGQTDCSSEFKGTSYSGVVCSAGAAPYTATITESFKPDVYAKPVILKWSLTSSQTTSGSSRSTGSLSSTLVSTTPNTSSTSLTSSASQSDDGISKGAIAGIVVGAVAVLALVIGAILLVLRRRKRKFVPQLEPNHQHLTATSGAYYETKPELSANSPSTAKFAPSISGQSMQPSPMYPVELAGEHSNHHQSWISPTQQNHLRPHDMQNLAYDQQSHMSGSQAGSQFANPHNTEATGPPDPTQPTLDQARVARLAEIEAQQRELEAQMARLRHISAMEQENGRSRAELSG